MKSTDIVGVNRTQPSVLSAFLGVLLCLAGLTSSALAQPLYTITAQDRTLTAMCGQQTNTVSATHFGTWISEVGASGPGGSYATASQTSTVSPMMGLSGQLRSISYDRGAPSAGTGVTSLTFTTNQRLRFVFNGYNASFGGVDSRATFAIVGVFSRAVGLYDDVVATGVLRANTSYTFDARLSGGNRDGEFAGANYTLTLTPMDTPPDVIAGPITRLSNCHRYFQLAPSSWFAAEDRAIALGGHLVTINDAQEQAWTQTTFASLGLPNKWIGLRCLLARTVFTWSSGQPTSYYNHWAPGFPSEPLFQPLWPHFGYYSPTGLWMNAPQAQVAGGIVEVEACRCDWNYDLDRTSNDFFAFLTDFFAGNADFDCSGSTNSNDFFQFLECLLATTCP